MEEPPAAQAKFQQCHQCNNLQKREDAKFCFYCGAILAILCKKCNTHNTYGSDTCQNCGDVILHVLDVSTWYPPDGNGEDEQQQQQQPVLLGHTTINGVVINLFWTSDTFPKRKRRPRRIRSPTVDTVDRSDNEYTESSLTTTDATTTDATTTDPTHTDELLSDNEDEFTIEESSGVVSQREHVINEVISTENDYLNDLDVIIEVYKAGLEALTASGPQSQGKVLSAAEIEKIFGNIDAIRDTNFQLFRYMQAADDCPGVPQAFLMKADSLEIYSLYCSSLENAIDYITQLQKTKPIVSTFLMNCRNRPECKRLDVNSWLIKPLQRLCKYPLLLKELIKATEENHADLPVLQEALKKVEGVVAHVNNYKKDVEFKRKIAELATMYDGAEVLKLGSVTGRQFVQDGRILLQPKGKGSDVLLLSKKRKIIDNIPLELAVVKENPKIEKGVDKTTVEITYIGVRMWTIIIESEAERIMFLRNITECIEKAMEVAYNKHVNTQKVGGSSNSEEALVVDDPPNLANRQLDTPH